MRRLTILVLVLATLYSGYWFFGARAVASALDTGLNEARMAGWQISYADLNTVGFPSRFDTTVTEVAVADPDGRFVWSAPFLQVFALSYQPNRVIAAFPPDQSVQVAGQTVEITADRMRASAGVKPNTALSFDATTFEAEALRLTSDLGWDLRIEQALAAIRAAKEEERTYDLYTKLDQIALPADLLATLDPGGDLSPVLTHLLVDAQLTLDQPLDRTTQNPAPERILLKTANAVWGDITVRAEGKVDVDALGVPDGRITLTTAQWREIIDLMATAGVIEDRFAPTLLNVANAMTQGEEVLELPISFQNGFMSVGPLPLGPAPRLR